MLPAEDDNTANGIHVREVHLMRDLSLLANILCIQRADNCKRRDLDIAIEHLTVLLEAV